MPLKPTKNVNEGSDCRIKTYFKDYDQVAIADTQIVTAVYTLRNKRTNKIINSKEDVDCSSFFDSVGLLTVIIPATDNIIISQKTSRKIEVHNLRFTIVATVSGADTTFTEDVWIRVLNSRAE